MSKVPLLSAEDAEVEAMELVCENRLKKLEAIASGQAVVIEAERLAELEKNDSDRSTTWMGVIKERNRLIDELEFRLAELERDRDELLRVVKSLRVNGCWCGVGIGDPRMSDHSERCKRAQKAIDQELQ